MHPLFTAQVWSRFVTCIQNWHSLTQLCRLEIATLQFFIFHLKSYGWMFDCFVNTRPKWIPQTHQNRNFFPGKANQKTNKRTVNALMSVTRINSCSFTNHWFIPVNDAASHESHHFRSFLSNHSYSIGFREPFLELVWGRSRIDLFSILLDSFDISSKSPAFASRRAIFLS